LEKFNCIGTYADAETKEAFTKVLENIVSKALLNTTVQINLNDIHKSPKETDVTMFLYEAGTTNLKYTFTHTINKYGNPDTLIIDPKIKYDLVVNTTPRVEKKNIAIQRNVHNTITVDSPQGYLKIRFTNADRQYQIDARVMLSETEKTLNTQKISETDKYIVGKYDIEILTLPRIYITTDIEQSSTSTINISAPGFFNYSTGQPVVGQIFSQNSNGSWDWVCNFDENSRTGEFQLQPGAYRIVYRQSQLKSSTYTMEQNFRINSNKTVSLRL